MLYCYNWKATFSRKFEAKLRSSAPVFPHKQARPKQPFLRILISAMKIFTQGQFFKVFKLFLYRCLSCLGENDLWSIILLHFQLLNVQRKTIKTHFRRVLTKTANNLRANLTCLQ